MRKFFEPSEAPAWLSRVLSSIREALGDVWGAPIRPWQAATASLPPAADYAGGLAWNTTVNRFTYSDGSAWQQLQPVGGAWSAFTPTVSSGSGAFTTVSGAIRYAQVGKTVFIHVQVTITTNGTAATYVSATLPVAAAASGMKYILNGKETASAGFMLTGQISGSTILIGKYDGTYPGGTGFVLELTGCYEAA